MARPDPLEVTITHNLDNADEIALLLDRRYIALDWGRKGPAPEAYTHPRARQDVKLFHEMRHNGAAVIAAYKGATAKRSLRIVGWVAPGTNWKRLNGLLCLPLSQTRIEDASANFLGNLTPRQCTVQRCHNRARGQLINIVLGRTVNRDVTSLHHRDVEWLVTNFLFAKGTCSSVWTGCRSFEDIDHAGCSPSGRAILAQTTVSKTLVGKKAERLRKHKSEGRELFMFGPESAREQCPSGIRYHSIEEVFSTLDRSRSGHWLINRMLATTQE
jgi:hypothetical protein